jgi:hypothetical protein
MKLLFKKFFGGESKSVCKIDFGENGHVTKIDIPEGQWTLKQSGQNKYYSQNAKNLLRASEILKKILAIPAQTYYTVQTPDGSVCRDKIGFYSIAPIKSENIVLDLPRGKPEIVDFESLKDFDETTHISILNTVAYLKQSGEYAKLVLLMKCGKCGYESPIETQAGILERECYCCGAKNKGERGNINVFVRGIIVQI